jgi:hypothetical protein
LSHWHNPQTIVNYLARLEPKKGCAKKFNRRSFKFVQCGLHKYNRRLQNQNVSPVPIRPTETRHPFDRQTYATFDKVLAAAQQRFSPKKH